MLESTKIDSTDELSNMSNSDEEILMSEELLNRLVEAQSKTSEGIAALSLMFESMLARQEASSVAESIVTSAPAEGNDTVNDDESGPAIVAESSDMLTLGLNLGRFASKFNVTVPTTGTVEEILTTVLESAGFNPSRKT
ncbi:MAG: hypothetical protein ACRC8K_18830, partial [Waterburya sp.]